MFTAVTESSILGRAGEKGILDINLINIRDFSTDKHNKADDYPFGGGVGMVMLPQPVFDALKSLEPGESEKEPETPKKKMIYMSPRGRILDREKIEELAEVEEMTILCGHYEGVDQRIIDEWDMEEISIGDYILTGGEQAAQIMLRCVQPDAGLPAQPVHFFRTVRAGPYAAQHRIAEGAPTRIKQLPYPAQCPARGAVIAHQSFFTATITRTRLPAAQPKLSYQPVR